MQKLCFFLLIATTILLASCKKDKELDPGSVLKNDLFLRSVKVAGAREVTVDTARRYIYVALPEAFSSDIIDIELGAAPGAELELTSWTPLYTPGHVRFNFKGLPPENFTLSQKASSNTRSYKVFVTHDGPLTAEMTSTLDLHASGTKNADGIAKIRIKSGVGSIPENPDTATELIPFLDNKSKNAEIRGSFDNGAGTIFFEGLLHLMEVEGTTLSLKYGEKVFQFPQAMKLSRSEVALNVAQPDRLFKVFTTGKSVPFNGGIFLNTYKYTLKLQNEALSVNMSLPATVADLSTLQALFPTSLANGQYKVEFFENSQLLAQAAIMIARDSTARGIGQMWAGGTNIPWEELWATKPVSIARGQELFANPFPATMDASSQPFDNGKKVPDLALKLNGKVTILKATVKADTRYADNSIRIYYGAYRIPENLLPGRYEASLVSENKQHSLPYWNLIEIR